MLLRILEPPTVSIERKLAATGKAGIVPPDHDAAAAWRSSTLPIQGGGPLPQRIAS
jgi:hypothetical protein